MTYNLSYFGIALLLFLARLPLLAQEEDSLSAISYVTSSYLKDIKGDSFLNEGREYLGPQRKIEGHAFFENNVWQEADLFYKGQRYQQVPLLYDIYGEELIVRHFRGFYKIKLIKDQVDSFSLLDHHFVRIEGNDAKGSPMISGFYDRLYKGNLQVLVKRKKNLLEEIDNLELRVEYVQEDQFFIEKGGTYYPVKKKGSVLKVLKDHKKEIRRYLKKNKIRFRKNPEKAIVKMVAFYDQHHKPQ